MAAILSPPNVSLSATNDDNVIYITVFRYHGPVSKAREIFTNPAYKLPLSFRSF